ncbi:MAG: phenylacetate--CoA ligase family protein [Christensenellales bacterium]|jgi:phenylacetate-CoA ligase
MNYYNEIECMDRDALTSLQSDRLRRVVERVYNNNYAYRNKMDLAGIKPSDIKSIEDITKLPFTVKQDLRDSYPFGFFSAPKKDIIRIHASSGTTGKLTVVGYTKSDIDIWAEVCARSLVCAGADEHSLVHIAYGYGLFTGGLGMHYGSEKLGCATIPVSSGNTMRQITLMKDFGADVICCTPSYAIYLADEIEKNNIDKSELKLKAGIFGAEPWSDEMRKEIESRLNIKAYNIYGLSEICGPGVSMECKAQDGMHIFEDHFYPEIINPDTLEPVADGERGELVITTLTKEGIPLIRYRTRDITAVNREKCDCGRTMVRMGRVFGRTDDMLIIRGVNVFPSQIETVIMNVGGGVQPHYQIIVDRKDSLDVMEIRIEISESVFSDEIKVVEALRKRLEHDMQSMLGISATIKLVSPNSLPRSEGKAKRVMDLRKL